MPELQPYRVDPDVDDVLQEEPQTRLVVPVEHEGPVRTQELPGQGAATLSVAVSGTTKLLRGDPRRKRAVLVAPDAQWRLAFDRSVLDGGGGMVVPVATPVTLTCTDEVWVAPVGNSGTLAPVGANGSFAAGAAGSVFLPTGATYLTGWDVTIGAPVAGNPVTTVTVASVTGGNYVYDVIEATAGTTVSRTYSGSGLSALAGLNPGVSIAAIANGGAGHINVYGLSPVSTVATISVVTEMWTR